MLLVSTIQCFSDAQSPRLSTVIDVRTSTVATLQLSSHITVISKITVSVRSDPIHPVLYCTVNYATLPNKYVRSSKLGSFTLLIRHAVVTSPPSHCAPFHIRFTSRRCLQLPEHERGQKSECSATARSDARVDEQMARGM